MNTCDWGGRGGGGGSKDKRSETPRKAMPYCALRQAMKLSHQDFPRHQPMLQKRSTPSSHSVPFHAVKPLDGIAYHQVINPIGSRHTMPYDQVMLCHQNHCPCHAKQHHIIESYPYHAMPPPTPNLPNCIHTLLYSLLYPTSFHDTMHHDVEYHTIPACCCRWPSPLPPR